MITKEQADKLKEGDYIYCIEKDDRLLISLHCCKIVSDQEWKESQDNYLQHTAPISYLKDNYSMANWFLTPQEGFKELEDIPRQIKKQERDG